MEREWDKEARNAYRTSVGIRIVTIKVGDINGKTTLRVLGKQDVRGEIVSDRLRSVQWLALV